MVISVALHALKCIARDVPICSLHAYPACQLPVLESLESFLNLLPPQRGIATPASMQMMHETPFITERTSAIWRYELVSRRSLRGASPALVGEPTKEIPFFPSRLILAEAMDCPGEIIDVGLAGPLWNQVIDIGSDLLDALDG